MFDPCSMCAYPRALVCVKDFYRPGPLLFFVAPQKGTGQSANAALFRSNLQLEKNIIL